LSCPGTDSPGASDAAASSKADVDFDFVLCVGDDRSDEDMYQLLKAWHARRAEHDADKGGDDAPAQLYLVHIGTGATQAEYYLESVIELRKLLRGMASISLRDLRGAPRAF
jgi:trehalose 6-phosphate synthase/phosphatase